MKQLKYKALILDIDGTLIKNSSNEILPTKKVVDAIKTADKLIHIGVATSRPLSFALKVIENLNLSAPCIITGGAHIYDPVRKQIIYEKLIDNSAITHIYQIVNKYNLTVLDDGRGVKSNIKENEVINPTQFWINIENQNLVEEVFADLSKINNVSVHKMISRFNGGIEINVNHTQATKQYGIQKVSEILGIKTKEIIGVGDGYNDFPLLMACGLKVAMGNGVDEIKEIADYIAPSITEDGVVDVIERFILNERSD